MLRSLPLSIWLACAFAVPVVSQTSTGLTAADKQERQKHGVMDLAGPLKSVVVREAHFSTEPNELAKYVEEARKQVKTLFFDTEGKLTEIETGRRFRCGTKDGENKKIIERYDVSGRKTGAIEEIYDAYDRLLVKTDYEYDTTGLTRILSWAIYGPDGLIMSKMAYKYDVQGREIERDDFGQDGLLTSKNVYIRNEKGLVIESIENSSTDPLPINRTVMSYEYDDNGNWVKCTPSKFITEGGASFLKPVYVVYRTITYYSQNQKPD